MPSNLKFLVIPFQENRPAGLRDQLLLEKSNWDDYGHQILFQLTYIDSDGRSHDIGATKVLQREKDLELAKKRQVKLDTVLPRVFESLDNSYVSLGQDKAFYTNLVAWFGDRAEDCLIALNDIGWRPAGAQQFEATSAYRNALLRVNVAQRSLRFARAWVLGRPENDSPAFKYVVTIAGADDPTAVSIDFDGDDPVPGRIACIIGRNATGKTRFLAQLGTDLAHLARESAKREKQRAERFPEMRPLFSRVIAISYSAFDNFRRPRITPESSYVYCGIRGPRGALSKGALQIKFWEDFQKIRKLERQRDWYRFVRDILGEQSAPLLSQLEMGDASPRNISAAVATLSSGQAILTHFVTALLAWIQPHSIVLFDEPETHLHPNAVANLVNVMGAILDTYESYALIATHSPVVLQQIPGKRAILFERAGNVTTGDAVDFETFGESVAELTKHIFETLDVEGGYRRVLKRLATQHSESAVLELFPKGLSLNAMAYLLAQYPTSGAE